MAMEDVERAVGNDASRKRNAAASLTLATSGRPPWYNADGQNSETYIVGIAGGSASGKTSVSDRIIKLLGVPWVVILSMDSFYKPLSPEAIALAHQNEWNFDSPESLDYDILLETLKKLKQGKSVEVPIYDFKTHSRSKKTQTVYGANVVIFEGIYALYDKKIMELMDLKIYVDTDADIRLARRLKRDIAERNRDMHGVLQQYSKFVKPMYDEFIHPTMRNADVIIPRGLENTVAIDLMTNQIRRQLHDKALAHRARLARVHTLGRESKLPDNVVVLRQGSQLKGIHTILRDENTSRDDFIFYARRLSVIVVERALAELPFSDKKVFTPLDREYNGRKLTEKICGVSILRSGSAMETGLRKVIKDVCIGKLLIQTDRASLEPLLHYCKLPSDINQRHVLLLDASVGTGAAAIMAIRVLLDHDVPEDRIIMCCLLAAPPGLHGIASAFPKVRVVTSAVDPGLDAETFRIVPGLGNFGDMFFGTSDDGDD